MIDVEAKFHLEVAPLASMVNGGYEDLVVICPDDALGIGHISLALGDQINRNNFYICADGSVVPPVSDVVKMHLREIDSHGKLNSPLARALRYSLGMLIKTYIPSKEAVTKDISQKLRLGMRGAN